MLVSECTNSRLFKFSFTEEEDKSLSKLTSVIVFLRRSNGLVIVERLRF